MTDPVRCPGCGRVYGATRFRDGRTLTCTCGRRVGPRDPVPAPSPADGPRFFADAMLGRLARWLRTLGYDTAYEEHIADADLVRRALAEERIILTRDTDLVREWGLEGVVLVESEEPVRQLGEVAAAASLEGPRRLFGRCRLCNEPLRAVGPDRVRDRAPRGVLERHHRFLECPACERVYWEGSHAERMRRVVESVFG